MRGEEFACASRSQQLYFSKGKPLVALQFSKTENTSTQGDTCKVSLLALIPALEADSPAEDRSFPAPSEHTHSEPNLCNYS